jgi:DNA-binding beta-propeller fold protein YncE/predicted Ser/Thr protein kinase
MTFGHYRLLGVLGRGGMGVVYRAEHEHLGRVVALKLLTPELAESAGFRERFQREARLAASVEHAHIVPVYDAGESNGTLYIAMRYIEGTDLASVLAREGALEPGRAASIASGIGSALDAAHARGLVHRDVKPANVLIDSERCYLTDFGLVKPFEAETTALTAAGQFLGTLDYVAPEQIEGRQVDGRVDVYALGCMLHECLTGARPFARDTAVAVMYAHLHDPPPRPTDFKPELPPAIDAVVARAMAKDREERYASGGELAAAAREALAPRAAPTTPAPPASAQATAPLPAPSPAAGTQVLPERRRRPGALIVGLGVLAVAAVVAALMLSGSSDDDSASQGAEPSGAAPQVATASIPVGDGPSGVTVTGGEVWVANTHSGTLTRVSADGKPLETIEAGAEPRGLAASAGTVWVANAGNAELGRIDAANGNVQPGLAVEDAPHSVAAGATRVFVTNEGAGTVSEFYVPSGEPRRAPFASGTAPRGIAIADEAIWVANSGDATVTRIAHGKITDTIEVGAGPSGVAAGAGAIWVTNEGDGNVSRIDVANPDAEPTTVEAGDAPIGIAYGEGSVWVANSGDGTVSRLDPADGATVGEPIDVPGTPTAIAAGEGAVWVTVTDRDALIRLQP